MTIQNAIRIKIFNHLKEENISINELSLRSCLTQSTLQSFLTKKTSKISLETLNKICYGMNTTVQDFFKDKIFYNIRENC